MHDNRRSLLTVIILAVIAHVALIGFVHVVKGGVDVYAFRSLDAQEYYQIARHVVDHGAFSQAVTEPFEPDTWRTPGYPIFLAGFIWLFGAIPTALILAQQFLCVLNAALFLFVVRSYMSPGRAMLAVGFFVLEPYHLFYSLWLMATTLFVTLLLLVWLSWRRAERMNSVWWFIVAGVLSGMLVLVRPIGILVPVLLALRGFLGIVSPWSRPSSSLSRWTWPMLAGFCVATMSTIGPWIGRNIRVANQIALSDQSGVVMAYFKAAEVVLWRQGRSADRFLETSLDPRRSDYPHSVWDEIDRRLRKELYYLPESQRNSLHWANLAQGNKTDVDSFLISKQLMRIGLSYMIESPLSTVACLTTRCGSILTFPLNLVLEPAAGVEESRERQLVKSFPYLIITVLVLWTVIRQRRAWRDWCIPMLLLLALLIMSTPQFDPRFRVPMMPMLLVLAFFKPIAPEETVKVEDASVSVRDK